MCKRIGYEFYCEELFVLKHKTSYSCESAIYFNLDMGIIKENCDFKFNYNNTHIIPTVLDGGDEIIWQIGLVTSIFYAIQIMTSQLKYLVTCMF